MNRTEDKLQNLDTFFDIKREDSPKDLSEFDYKELGENYEMNQEYQDIIEQAKSLSKTEHLEIFKIIEANHDDYTVNDNGVFIALNKVKVETLKKIKQSINFYLVNRQQLQKDLAERNSIREIMNCQTADKSPFKGFNKSFRITEKN